MSPLEIADRLKTEADLVLQLVSFEAILRPYGLMYPTGSYYLNVMAYPDIDIYLTQVSVDHLFDIGSQVAACDLVTQVVFERSDDPLNLPEGLYLKTRLDHGDWGRPWKIDLWSLPESVIQRKMDDMHHFQQKMTPFLREQIIRYKLSVLTSQKRTPMYSGYYIYQAFIDQGLTDFSSVTSYLISHGIDMSAGN